MQQKLSTDETESQFFPLVFKTSGPANSWGKIGLSLQINTTEYSVLTALSGLIPLQLKVIQKFLNILLRHEYAARFQSQPYYSALC